MMRKVLFALLFVPVLFTACKKSEDTPNEFVVNGIRDVNMGTLGSNVLPLAISVSSGVQERVTLSVTNLPTGITATIDPSSGTPTFTSTITFSQNAFVTAGTYPIHVVATSASYTKSYDLNIIVPALNGWLVDGTAYRLSGMSTNSILGYSLITMICHEKNDAMLSASVQSTLPTADGSYTYYLYNSSDMTKNMYVTFDPGTSSGSYNNTGLDNKTATLKVSGGKYSLSFPTTEFKNGSSSDTKMISVDATEL